LQWTLVFWLVGGAGVPRPPAAFTRARQHLRHLAALVGGVNVPIEDIFSCFFLDKREQSLETELPGLQQPAPGQLPAVTVATVCANIGAGCLQYNSLPAVTFTTFCANTCAGCLPYNSLHFFSCQL
jgi:hypothetical protein